MTVVRKQKAKTTNKQITNFSWNELLLTCTPHCITHLDEQSKKKSPEACPQS
jgi:hypothetical protein